MKINAVIISQASKKKKSILPAWLRERDTKGGSFFIHLLLFMVRLLIRTQCFCIKKLFNRITCHNESWMISNILRPNIFSIFVSYFLILKMNLQRIQKLKVTLSLLDRFSTKGTSFIGSLFRLEFVIKTKLYLNPPSRTNEMALTYCMKISRLGSKEIYKRA